MRADRLRLVTAALVSSLLLAGCGTIPTSLEDFVGWREKFILGFSESDVQTWFGPILVLIAVVAFTRGIFSLLPDEEGNLQTRGIKIAAIQFVCLIGIYLFPYVINSITVLYLNPDITLDTAIKNLGLTLSIDPKEIIAGAWAIGITISLPIWVIWGTFTLLVIQVILLSYSVFTQSIKVAWVILGSFFGHALFLAFYSATQSAVPKMIPAWDTASSTNITSFFYVGLVMIVFALCYFVIPMTGFFMGPDLVIPRKIRLVQEPQGKEPETKMEKKRRKRLDYETLETVFGSTVKEGSRTSPRSTPPKKEGENGSSLVFPKLPSGPEGGGDINYQKVPPRKPDDRGGVDTTPKDVIELGPPRGKLSQSENSDINFEHTVTGREIKQKGIEGRLPPVEKRPIKVFKPNGSEQFNQQHPLIVNKEGVVPLPEFSRQNQADLGDTAKHKISELTQENIALGKTGKHRLGGLGKNSTPKLVGKKYGKSQPGKLPPQERSNK